PETFFNKPVSDIGAESDEEATEESDGGAEDAQEEEMPENDRLEDEDTDTPDDVEDGETDEDRSEEHTSELQSRFDLVCRLLLEKKNIYFISLYGLRCLIV